jgi:hypothetical protein
MNSNDAYRLELQTAMQMCYLNGDIDGAETYQMMIDEFDENCEDDTVSSYLAECGL